MDGWKDEWTGARMAPELGADCKIIKQCDSSCKTISAATVAQGHTNIITLGAASKGNARLAKRWRPTN